jgi:hypothetical protein
MLASYFGPIRAIWSNFLVVRQMFAYGIMGWIIGVIMALLVTVVDVIGSLVGLVLLFPVLLITGLFKLIFGRM